MGVHRRDGQGLHLRGHPHAGGRLHGSSGGHEGVPWSRESAAIRYAGPLPPRKEGARCLLESLQHATLEDRMPLLSATQGFPMTRRILTPDMSWVMFFNVFASLLFSSPSFYCQVASFVNIIIYWFQVALSPAAAFRHSSRQKVDGGTNLR